MVTFGPVQLLRRELRGIFSRETMLAGCDVGWVPNFMVRPMTVGATSYTEMGSP
jgi:hypothetical protein